jgi:lysophospholipid acyltransferase (LPLAT)-like uncharacterized protein
MKILREIIISVIGNILYYIIHFVNKTIKLNVINNSGIVDFEKEKIVYAVWHQDTFTGFYHSRNKNMAFFVTNDKKGDILNTAVRCLGFDTLKLRDDIPALFIDMGKKINNGQNVVFAVDGPSGPKGKVKAGVFYLSDQCEAQIVPVNMIYTKHFKLLWRWDKYKVPLPFSTVTLTYCKPIKGIKRKVDTKNALG